MFECVTALLSYRSISRIVMRRVARPCTSLCQTLTQTLSLCFLRMELTYACSCDSASLYLYVSLSLSLSLCFSLFLSIPSYHISLPPSYTHTQPNQADGNGHSPVFHVCESGHLDILQLLLHHNAEYNLVDEVETIAILSLVFPPRLVSFFFFVR